MPQRRSIRRSGWVVFFCLGVAGLASACSAPAAKAPAAREGEPKKPELRLNKTLPLSDSEICFNAWDDNRNSLIDEGCDVAQSQFQVLIAWAEESADVDLYVHDPAGEAASAGVVTSSGLSHSSDCPSEKGDCSGQNFENVFLEEEDLLGGSYLVRVRLEELPEGRESLSVALGIRIQDRSFAHEIVFFEEGQEKTLKIDVEGTPLEEDEDRPKKEALPQVLGKE